MVPLANFSRKQDMKSMIKKLEQILALKVLNTEDKLLAKVNNLVVYLHFRCTPTMATNDTLSEIILEQLGRFEHQIEMRRHTNLMKSLAIVNEIKYGISPITIDSIVKDNIDETL